MTCVMHKEDILTHFPKLYFFNMKSVEWLQIILMT